MWDHVLGERSFPLILGFHIYVLTKQVYHFQKSPSCTTPIAPTLIYTIYCKCFLCHVLSEGGKHMKDTCILIPRQNCYH